VNDSNLKIEVKEFWDKTSCGEVYASGESQRDYYTSHSAARYTLEPYIHSFARFDDAQGKDVLEIGVGMGADHLEFAKFRPKTLVGVDLTPRAVEHTRRRLMAYGFIPDVKVADAENLPFDDQSFDIVYSWGVLHHSPDTSKAIGEVFRVLRPGGIARVMVYHKYSLTGYMLWTRYALLAGRPFRSLNDIYFHHLESRGTKAYSVPAVKKLFAEFSDVVTHVQLSVGDLLLGAAGQRHARVLLTVARRLWPRFFLRRFLSSHGLFLLVEARKPEGAT
jgi:ubiquinone/menaquinone biosynthesis C-methylase UbiE